jgi:hypothetical protein
MFTENDPKSNGPAGFKAGPQPMNQIGTEEYEARYVTGTWKKEDDNLVTVGQLRRYVRSYLHHELKKMATELREEIIAEVAAALNRLLQEDHHD